MVFANIWFYYQEAFCCIGKLASFSIWGVSERMRRLVRHLPFFHRRSINTPRTHSSAARAIHKP